MTTLNPLLEASGLPRFSAIKPEHVEPAVDGVLADYRARIDALLASDAPRDFASVVLLGEELEDRLNRVWAPVSHLHGVADSEELRKAYSAAQEKIVEHASELGQNRELYAAVKAVDEAHDTAALPRAARTLVEHELRDFQSVRRRTRRAGALAFSRDRQRIVEIRDRVRGSGARRDRCVERSVDR